MNSKAQPQNVKSERVYPRISCVISKGNDPFTGRRRIDYFALPEADGYGEGCMNGTRAALEVLSQITSEEGGDLCFFPIMEALAKALSAENPSDSTRGAAVGFIGVLGEFIEKIATPEMVCEFAKEQLGHYEESARADLEAEKERNTKLIAALTQ